MKLVAALLLASSLGVSAANAALVTQNFQGSIDDGTYTGLVPVGVSFMPGDTVTGSYTFDTTANVFTALTIGGFTPPAGSATIYSPPLTSTSYVFAGEKATDASGNVTSLFQFNFYEEAAPFPNTTDIGAFLASPYYSTDVSGGSPSSFSVLIKDASGNVVTAFGATLAPEPASMALIGAGVAGLALVRRRRA